MNQPALTQAHLTHISTLWTVVRKAHGGDDAGARSAQALLIERYSPAVYHYLLAVLRDEDAADEVFQEFALRLLRGSFTGANPSRGRFRDYLKTAILHLVTDFRRGAARAARHRTHEGESGIAAPFTNDDHADDRLFLHTWRQTLLNRAWDALAEQDGRTRQPLYHVLRLRSDRPDADSSQLAAMLTQRLNPPKPFTAAGTRKLLQRAREAFAQLLVREVAASLHCPTQAAIEQELMDLALHTYCRSALHSAGTSPPEVRRESTQ